MYFNLRKKLLKVGKQKKGDTVTLNPQSLKDLYKLVMLELSPSERAAVAIYELQTFIIEQAMAPKEYYEGMNFEMFLSFLMANVRMKANLWIKSSEQYKKII